MYTRVIRMYFEFLEEVIDSVANDCETITAEDELSDYQADKLKALKLLYNDLSNIKRVDNFFKD